MLATNRPPLTRKSHPTLSSRTFFMFFSVLFSVFPSVLSVSPW